MKPYFKSLHHFIRFRNHVLRHQYAFFDHVERDDLVQRLRRFGKIYQQKLLFSKS